MTVERGRLGPRGRTVKRGRLGPWGRLVQRRRLGPHLGPMERTRLGSLKRRHVSPHVGPMQRTRLGPRLRPEDRTRLGPAKRRHLSPRLGPVKRMDLGLLARTCFAPVERACLAGLCPLPGPSGGRHLRHPGRRHPHLRPFCRPRLRPRRELGHGTPLGQSADGGTSAVGGRVPPGCLHPGVRPGCARPGGRGHASQVQKRHLQRPISTFSRTPSASGTSTAAE